MNEPAENDDAGQADDIADLRERMERFFKHLASFADSTAARIKRLLVPVRIFAAISLLSAVVIAWRMGPEGSIGGFFLLLGTMSLPAAFLFGFYFLFQTVSDLPEHLGELRLLVAGLGPNLRSNLDERIGRTEGSRFGLGRIIALGKVLMELRHIASAGTDLPAAFAMAPMMANPLFWILFAFSFLTATAVIGLAALLLGIAAFS